MKKLDGREELEQKHGEVGRPRDVGEQICLQAKRKFGHEGKSRGNGVKGLGVAKMTKHKHIYKNPPRADGRTQLNQKNHNV